MKSIWIIASALIGISTLAALLVVGRQALKRVLSRKLLKQASQLRSVLETLHQSNFEGIDKMLFDMRDTYDLRVIEAEFHHALTEKNIASSAKFVAAFDQLGLIDQYVDRVRNASSWRERARVAAALGALGDTRSVSVLLEAMRDPREDGDVKLAAAEALGQINSTEVIPLICSELSNTDEWSSPRLAQILTRFGEAALPALIDTVENASSLNARIWASQILGKIGNHGAVLTLLKRLHDRSEQMRMSVSAALGDIGDNRAMRSLVDIIIRDPVASVRAQAASALGRIQDESSLPLLINALGDPEYWVRFRALEAIESMNVQDTAPIEQALTDSSAEVRKRAALALERLGVLEKDFERLLDDDATIYEEARSRLIAMGRAGLSERLARHLDEDNPRMRLRIASLLGPVGDVHHADFLCERLVDPEIDVRLAVIKSLGDLAVAHTASALVPLLADSHSGVQEAAFEALKRYDQPTLQGLLPNLEGLAGNDHDLTRFYAIRTLSVIDSPDVNTLLQVALGDRFVEVRIEATSALGARRYIQATGQIASHLTDSHADLRLAAADALGSIGGREALDALLAVVDRADDDQRDSICQTLAVDGFAAVTPVLDMLMAKHDEKSRLAITWTLGKTGDEDAATLLSRLLKDGSPAIRASAAGALGKLPCQKSREALSGSTLDPSPRVRAASVNALGRVGESDAQQILLPLLSDPDAFIRNRCLIALSRLPECPAIDVFLDLPRAGISDAHFVIACVMTRDVLGVGMGIDAIADETRREAVEYILAQEDESVQERFKQEIYPGSVNFPDHIDAELALSEFEHSAQKSQDVITRRQALSVLAALRRPRVAEVLISTLASDPDPESRKLAVVGLKKHTRLSQARRALLNALSDPDAGVRPLAIAAACDFAKPGEVDSLFDGLQAKDAVNRDAALNALATIYRHDVDAIHDWTMSQHSEALICAGLGMIERIGDKRSLPLLEALLKSDSPRIRSACIRSVAALSTSKAVYTALGALKDPSEDVRIQVVRSMSGVDQNDVIQRLQDVAYDPSVALRSALVDTLATLTNTTAVAIISDLASDSSLEVRVAALGALLSHGEPDAQHRLLAHLEGQSAKDREAFLKLAAHQTSHLASQLRSALDANHRILAVRVLRAIDPVLHASSIAAGLSDPDAHVRLACVQALEGLEPSRIGDWLQALRDDPVQEVRTAVRRALLRLV